MTPHEHTHRSTAVVETDRATRWIKQLSSHLGRKAEVRAVSDGQLLLLGAASCLMTDDSQALRLTATAADLDALSRVEHVVGSHLERFAANEGLTVAWRRELVEPGEQPATVAGAS